MREKDFSAVGARILIKLSAGSGKREAGSGKREGVTEREGRAHPGERKLDASTPR